MGRDSLFQFTFDPEKTPANYVAEEWHAKEKLFLVDRLGNKQKRGGGRSIRAQTGTVKASRNVGNRATQDTQARKEVMLSGWKQRRLSTNQGH